MIPKTTEHYITRRNELLKLFQPKKQPVTRMQACARLEKIDSNMKAQSQLVAYYNSDHRQLEQKILSEIQVELSELQETKIKHEVAQQQAQKCLDLHSKLAKMRDEFEQSEW